MAESFDIVDVCETKNGSTAIVRGEEAFACAFVGRCFGATIGEGDWDIASLDVP
jgi:hypothetical protein